MRHSAILLLLVAFVATIFVTNASAQDDDKKKKKGAGKQFVNSVLRPFKKAELTDEQTKKAHEMIKQHSEKIMGLQKEANNILSDEQKKARRDAAKAAKEKGLKGKKANEFIMAEMKLDEATVEKMKKASKAVNEARMELQKGVYGLLTDEQKQKIPDRRFGGKGGAGKKKKKKKDDG